MPDWEYKKLDLNDLPRKTSDIDALNAAGDDDWELVSVTPNLIALLKRPISPEQTPRKGKPKGLPIP